MMGSVAKSKLGEMRFAKNDQKWNDNYREYKLSPEQLAEVIEKYRSPLQPLNHLKKDYTVFKRKEEKKCEKCGKDHYANNLCKSCNLKKIYYERINNGLCVKCGKEKNVEGRRCSRCIEKGAIMK